MEKYEKEDLKARYTSQGQRTKPLEHLLNPGNIVKCQQVLPSRYGLSQLLLHSSLSVLLLFCLYLDEAQIALFLQGCLHTIHLSSGSGNH